MDFFLAYLHLYIFLSLTAAPPAIAKYAKTGCSRMCGTVRIPYPFGIGAECSLNQWYTIDCNSSTPYLSSLKHLEVLSIDWSTQTVTVNTPTISFCQNNPVGNSSKTMSIDLGGSPFLFSKRHNKFVFVGCGSAYMMDNGRAVTGCSTPCLNVHNTWQVCNTPIPNYLKSYSINLIGLERLGEDRACGYAFLVNKALYNKGRLFVGNTSFIPISLLWTQTDSDQLTCCTNDTPERVKVDMFNGTSVDTWKCIYSYGKLKNPYLIDCDDDPVPVPKYAKTGCNDTCGTVMIPYPFGIGASCSINQWYTVDCNSSTPYLPAVNNLEVLDVSLRYQTVTLSTPRIYTCNEAMSIDRMSPFVFSKGHNKLVFEGCGTAAIMHNGTVLTACSTACPGVTLGDRSKCFGIGCCQMEIPYYLKSYNFQITSQDNGGCGSALVVDETLYDPLSFRNASFIPVSFTWTLTDSDQLTCCDENL